MQRGRTFVARRSVVSPRHSAAAVAAGSYFLTRAGTLLYLCKNP